MKPELPVLIKARALIADPAKWGKGVRGTRAGNRPLDTCCAAEAIEDSGRSDAERRNAARKAFARIIGTDKIVVWNDAHERTHAEVLAAFDKAIASAS